jgi:hypothetical protein
VETTCFDRLTRAVSLLVSRRRLGLALGLGPLALPGLADAKKKHKHKKKVTFNDFGCVNVGSFCKNDDQCCSGICQGKKGKKHCQAHDASTCQPGQDSCSGLPVPCTTSAGDPDGGCTITTGNASYCEADGRCFDCAKDADCVPFCGPQAACIVCAGCVTEKTVCVGPSACTFPM